MHKLDSSGMGHDVMGDNVCTYLMSVVWVMP